MKPVQKCAKYLYFAHFSRLFFNFEKNEYFNFYYFLLFFFFLGGGMGVAVEVILEDFIGEIV